MQKPVQVVWFKRDLRIEDHAALAEAARTGDPLLPLYIVEPGLWAQPDSAQRHWDFIRECLVELQEALGKLGAPLVIRTGTAVDVLADLHAEHSIAGLWSHQETGNAWTYQRDLDVKAWCSAHGVSWHEPRQFGVVRRITSRNGWAKQWDAMMGEPVAEAPRRLAGLPDVASERLPDQGSLGIGNHPCPQRQLGGRDAALSMLYTFLHERGQNYRRDMSSPVEGWNGCSRLSPYLAYGAVSMREVAQSLWLRQRELKLAAAEGAQLGMWRGSMSSFSGRLHWHCHFMQKLEDEPSIEFTELHPGYRGMRQDVDEEKFEAWSTGQTGFPFVDACMRSLIGTGWINFRMRAMLMATASYHLWLPWRATGMHLAQLFTDYEAGIHWPQSQMQSGTTGINTIRIYNPVKQGHDQDPDGVFVRQWVPELADVPDKFLQEPWKWDGAGQVLGKSYPHPVVDHIAAAKDAKERIYAVRRTDQFRAHAGDIQEKHGSRKSGVPNRGQRPKRTSRKQPVARQETMDF